MSTLYLLQYNNYYNRQVRKEETLDNYKQFLVQPNTDEYGNKNIIENVNFIDLDYINTTQVVNWAGTIPNYLIEAVDDVIRSRWFVIGYKKQNFGQYELQLRRDIVATYIDMMNGQPMFIEKATPLSLKDPAIFNSENMSFNQIKTGEYPLKDRTGCSWIIGYIPRNAFPTATDIDLTYNWSGTQYKTVTSLENLPFYKYLNAEDHAAETGYDILNDKLKITVKTFGFVRTGYSFGYSNWWYNIDASTPLKCNSDADAPIYIDSVYAIGSDSPVNGTLGARTNQDQEYKGTRTSGIDWSKWKNIINQYYGFMTADNAYSVPTVSISPVEPKNPRIYTGYGGIDMALSLLSKGQGFSNAIANVTGINSENLLSSSIIDSMREYNNKIIYVSGSGNYYKLQLAEDSTPVYTPLNDENYLSNNSTTASGKDWWTNPPDASTFLISGTYKTYSMRAVPVANLKMTMPASDSRYHLNDSPYDMFCIPYNNPNKGEVLKIFDSTTETTPLIENNDSLAGMSMAMEIVRKSGGALYDVQLLPYCPISTIIRDGAINFKSSSGTNEIQYAYTPIKLIIGTNTKPVSVMAMCTDSAFTFDIPYNIPEELTILDKKIKSETEMWRLCSPNYSGVFEFNPQMNGGVTGFNIDCNYKPFSPYIHINPLFNDFYGQDWNDSRGLICGGDWSLPQITDAWQQYLLNNKNYQQMFDREITNLQINNQISKTQEEYQIAASAKQAQISGYQYGNSKMLGYGALFGQGAKESQAFYSESLRAGQMDMQLSDQLRQESLNYKKDMFGYQLGNIQAIPAGLAKVSAFTYNNKIYPFLEKYEADINDQTYQVDALKNKLKYNGYTIMRIGTLFEYMTDEESYIKGKIIRVPDIFPEDFHIAAAFVDELDSGIFVKNNMSLLPDPEEEEEEV